MELMRSLVFVPGNRANMLERALGFNADIVMVDLEDSVPPGEKETACDMAVEWVPRLHAAGAPGHGARQLAGHRSDRWRVGGGGVVRPDRHQHRQGRYAVGFANRLTGCWRRWKTASAFRRGASG